MNRRSFLGLVASLTAAVQEAWGNILGQESKPQFVQHSSQQGKTWAAFGLDDVNVKRTEMKRPYREFLRTPTLFAGLYVLPAGGEDRQQPHKKDEVYHIVSGKAVLKVGEDNCPVKAGSVVYVRAEIPHNFHTIEQELTVLVFFSTATPGEGITVNKNEE
ncbi:MAG TPA: cupin domain-containing protein [Bacteroidota bacterium]